MRSVEMSSSVSEAKVDPGFQDSDSLVAQTSVIIVNFNGGEDLITCIASIRKTEPKVEVVLVDNASQDGSFQRASARFPGIVGVQSGVNLGFGVGNNLGVQHASRELLVFLNPDTIAQEGWLEAMVRPLVEDETVGMVTPKVLLKSDSRRINVAGLNVHLSGISTCRGMGVAVQAFDEVEEVASISGVAFAVRREVFDVLGGFDPEFFLYMEDVDLSLRCWLSGYRCLYVPHPSALHEYTFRLDPEKTFHIEKGRYQILLKCFTGWTLLALLPTLLLVEIITWGWVVLLRPRAVLQKLKAYLWVIKHRIDAYANRDVGLQPDRAASSILLDRLGASLDFKQLAGPSLARAAAFVFNPLLKAAAVFARRLGR
ncbi:MAG: glycosyltransferase [Anaerolineales bacterium]|nr:glycosyltransferase [Anaerolineales bacterium]